jgi:hypothetical protein
MGSNSRNYAPPSLLQDIFCTIMHAVSQFKKYWLKSWDDWNIALEHIYAP